MHKREGTHRGVRTGSGPASGTPAGLRLGGPAEWISARPAPQEQRSAKHVGFERPRQVEDQRVQASR